MLGIGAPDVRGMWVGINRELFTRISDTEIEFHRQGFRKIAHTLIVRVNRWGAPVISMDEIGYAPQKHSQLVKIYYSEAEIARFKETRDKYAPKGKEFSLPILMRGSADKFDVVKTTKGPCLQAIIVVFIKGVPKKVHIFYRVTEVTKKFYADLVFLDKIFDDILGEHKLFCEAWFHLPEAYCHVKQFPVVDIIAPEWKEWVWKDKRMEEGVKKYLQDLRGRKLPSYGMVRRTGEWWVEKQGE